MSDQMKMAVMNSQNSDPWAATPRTNGIGLMAQGTQGLPPPVARMQGGFGLNPQMLGLLQQVSAPQAPKAAPMRSPFTMQSMPAQQTQTYGRPNWGIR